MSTAQPLPHLTLDEYLELPGVEGIRHEYVAGKVYAMTGGSLRHARLATRIAAALSPASERDGCRTYVADAQVLVGDDVVYFPDVMVACGVAVHERYETEPCLVVEVLSPSTRSIDEREKLSAYTSISTLRAYLIVHTDIERIDCYRRSDDGWTVTTHRETAEIELECPPTTLDVDALYASVFATPDIT